MEELNEVKGEKRDCPLRVYGQEEEVLLDCDGFYLCYTVRNPVDNQLFLVHWADASDTMMRFVFTPVSEQTVEDLKNKHITLVQAYKADYVWVIDSHRCEDEEYGWLVSWDDLDKSHFPEPTVFLETLN
jgi:hypothetical protein